jgi:hypothetical protein
MNTNNVVDVNPGIDYLGEPPPLPRPTTYSARLFETTPLEVAGRITGLRVLDWSGLPSSMDGATPVAGGA